MFNLQSTFVKNFPYIHALNTYSDQKKQTIQYLKIKFENDPK